MINVNLIGRNSNFYNESDVGRKPSTINVNLIGRSDRFCNESDVGRKPTQLKETKSL